MEDLMTSHNIGLRRRTNPTYIALRNKRANPKIQLDERRKLTQEMRLIPSKDMMDPGFRRLKYVRYADDFVIGISGPLTLARDILSRVQHFLASELGLNLNMSKTKVTHFSSRPIFFLGTEIKYRPITLQKKVMSIRRGVSVYKSRISPTLSFHAPIRLLLDKLVNRKFFR